METKTFEELTLLDKLYFKNENYEYRKNKFRKRKPRIEQR